MMATTRAHIRKPLTSRANTGAARPSTAVTRSIAKLQRRAIASWHEFVPWWNAQPDHRRLALVAVGLVALISVLNFTAAGVSRIGADQAGPAAKTVGAPTSRILVSEPAPVDPKKAWVATQLWQGSSNRVTESFTVGAHWRVDWLYNPPQSGGILQVFIYSADGALMQMAANTQQGGPDSSFWAGPGTYFLKVNSTGGDWKLDVQDLR
jgi:hypothetical protein